jgi:hypothetical protein
MTVTVAPDVRDYLAAVRAHLDDLPEDERDDLLEDLESHLVEVAAESDEPLAARLGPPDAYAADLRASAGLPPAGTNGARLRRVSEAQRMWRGIADHPIAQRVRGFLPELLPGWWVLRSVLAVWVLAMVTGDVDSSAIPFPPLFGSRFIGFLAMIAAVPLSIRLARRQQTDRRVNRAVHFGEALLLVFTIPLVGELNDRTYVWNDYGPAGYQMYGGALVGADGQPITNFYATDADGTPIEEFRLYDQNGQPVTNVGELDEFSRPDGVVRSQPPINRDGRPVPNGFPRDSWLERYDGSTAPVVPPALDPAATTIPSPEPGVATTAPPSTTTPPATTGAPTSTTVAVSIPTEASTTLAPDTATTAPG